MKTLDYFFSIKGKQWLVSVDRYNRWLGLKNYSQEARKVSCTTDPWSCVFCTSVLEEPVTLTCGHSSCKKCLLRDLTTVCRKCKMKYEPIEEDPIDVEPYVKVWSVFIPVVRVTCFFVD